MGRWLPWRESPKWHAPWAMPCYRVVNSKGELSGAFAFGGAEEQANRLRADGIAVINNRVDLVKYGMKL